MRIKKKKGLYCLAMATGDTRPVDEVMYYTRQLNPTINAGLVQPGTRIIVPCQQAER